MKNPNTEEREKSGLYIGSEPLSDLHDRGASGLDDNDGGKDKGGDSDGADSDGSDSDLTDEADGDGKDADGRD